MKRVLYIISVAVAVTLASCQKDADIDSGYASQVGAVQFSAEAPLSMTRVAGSVWESGDRIGISVASADVAAQRFNVEYITSGGAPADFTSAEGAEPIYYSESGASLTFDAYYPYQEEWSAESQVFDITAQNVGAQSLADLMLSATIEGQTEGAQSFEFSHALTKLQFNVANYEGETASIVSSLSDLSVELSGVMTQYDLVAGDCSTEGVISMSVVLDEDGQGAVATAILLPTSTESTVAITVAGVSYEATLVATLEAGMVHTYNLTVGVPEVDVEFAPECITSWNDSGSSTPSGVLVLVDGVYQIYSAAGMRLFAEMVNSGSYSLCGQLMCDIDLEGSADNKWTTICSFDDGTYYKGTFDGGGFEISGLYIDDNIYVNGKALFSATWGATIKNLSVSGSVVGNSYLAGIVGESGESTFINCHSSVTVTGNHNKIGGIAGEAGSSTFENCSNSGAIWGENGNIGGVVGYLYDSTMINCYNLGSVESANSSVGGVVGGNYSSAMSNCYNAGAVSNTGSSTSIGGVAGYVNGSSTDLPAVSDCYFDSTIYEGDAVGEIEEGYEDYVTNLVGYSTTYMQGDEFVKELNNGAYTYNASSPATKAYAWQVVEDGYPTFDTVNEPTYTEFEPEYDESLGAYLLYNAADMKLFTKMVNSGSNTINGKLMCDIDLEGSEDNQWTSIGNSDYWYQGTFDGAGFEVSGLYQSGQSEMGLINMAQGAVVKNLTVSGEITGGSYAAGIIMYSRISTIISCHNNVSVTSTSGNWVGGVAACALGCSIINCVNSAPISGSGNYTGGVVGFMEDYDISGDSWIVNCYNVGSVSGNTYQGAIIGGGTIANGVTDSYYLAGTSSVGAGEGYISSFIAEMSAAQMQEDNFVDMLNNGAYIYNASSPAIKACAWQAVEDGYPLLDTENEPELSDYVIDSEGTYLINTADGLVAFAEAVEAEKASGTATVVINAKLMSDVELSGEWTSIYIDGSNGNGYGGVFDGDGHSITGLSVSGSQSGQGLFGTCMNATIKNLTVGGSISNSTSHAAIIVGKAWYTTFESCETLKGSTVTATTSGDSFAGIAGYSYQCAFTSCINRADITGVSCSAGITGYTNDNTSYSTITDCKNYGTITATSTSNGHAAGIVGTTNSAAILAISNCYNEGVIKSESGNFAGGIVAKMYGTSSSRYSKIINCANVGAVSAASQYVGGLVGACAGSAIYNSYNLGEVSSDSSEVGGLVGIHEPYSSYNSVMENCYTSAAVSGESNAGLVVGKCDTSTISDCYYDSSQSGYAIGTDNNSQSVTAYSSLSALLTSLNSGTSGITNAATWVAVDDSYPTFSFINE